jgi:glycopeptide antibiotics resistance protein
MPGDINRYLNVSAAVWSTVVGVAVALVAAAVCYRYKGAVVAARVAGWLLLADSIAVILVITLFGRPAFESAGPFPNVSNWVPFRDINSELHSELHNVNRALGITNIVGNVALFVPSGILAGLLFRPKWTALLLAPVLSTGIEITQQQVGLSADIDDVILNTLGGVTGVALALLARRLTVRPPGAPDSSPLTAAHRNEQ